MIPTRLIALFALAVSLPFSESKDTSPIHITKPDGDTVWHAGKRYSVEWSPVHGPSKRTDKRKGELYLAQKHKTLSHLGGRFNVSVGKVDIDVPTGVNGTYEVILVSDSRTLGTSADFTIVNDDTDGP